MGRRVRGTCRPQVHHYCLVAKLCRTCDPTDCSTPGFPVLHHLPELAETHPFKSVMPSNHLILRRSLLLLPSVFPSIRVFSDELALCVRWLKYWSFSFSISPSNEYSELISFRADWFDLLAVQGTLKRLLHYHNSEASVLQHSTFFIVQLSHPYINTGKTIALTRHTFVSKVSSLLFNTLSRFVMAFLARSKCMLGRFNELFCFSSPSKSQSLLQLPSEPGGFYQYVAKLLTPTLPLIQSFLLHVLDSYILSPYQSGFSREKEPGKYRYT